MRQINFQYTLDKTFKEGVDYRACRKAREAGKDVSEFYYPKETMIYISWSIHNKYYKESIGHRIKPVDWCFNQRLPLKKKTQYRELSVYLTAVKSKIEKLYLNMKLNESEITSMTIGDLVRGAIHSNNTPSETGRFWQVFEEFLTEKIQLCRPSTVVKYQSLRKTLTGFEEAKYRLTFEAITKRWYTDFLLYSISLGHLNNTIGKNVRMVKAIMNFAYEMKYHNTLDFKRFKAEFETTEPIFLTMDELNAVEGLNTRDSVSKTISKGLFVVGALTGQRISDLNGMRKKDLKILNNDEMWWEVHQVKGRKLARVYIVSRARKILEKYLHGKGPNDYVFPRQSPAVTNKNLKEIGKGAGLTEMVTKVNYSGNIKKDVTRPKYAFLTTHVARKTFISLLCANKMPDHEIQSLSGHASNKEMIPYKGVDRGRVRDGLIMLFEPDKSLKRAQGQFLNAVS